MSFKIQIQSYNVCFYWYAQYFVRGWIHKMCAQWFEASCCHNLVILSPFITYLRICDKCNTTDPSCGTGSVYLSRAHAFNSCFLWCYCCLVLSFLCNILWITVCVFVLLIWPCIVCLSSIYFFWLPFLIKCSLRKHAIQCTMIYSSREEVRE